MDILHHQIIIRFDTRCTDIGFLHWEIILSGTLLPTTSAPLRSNDRISRFRQVEHAGRHDKLVCQRHYRRWVQSLLKYGFWFCWSQQSWMKDIREDDNKEHCLIQTAKNTQIYWLLAWKVKRYPSITVNMKIPIYCPAKPAVEIIFGKTYPFVRSRAGSLVIRLNA